MTYQEGAFESFVELMDSVPENIILEIQGENSILLKKGQQLPIETKPIKFKMPTKTSKSVEFILHMTSEKYVIDSYNNETLIGSFILNDIPVTGKERIIEITISMDEDLWITFTATVENIQASVTFNSRKEILTKKQTYIQEHFNSLNIDFQF